EWWSKKHFHVVYRHVNTGIFIEVHWHLQRPDALYRMDIDAIWQRAKMETLAGNKVLTMSPEHLLLHQCIHMVTHDFQVGLRAFRDIAEILRQHRDAINWDELIRDAYYWRADKAVFLAFYLTDEYFG